MELRCTWPKASILLCMRAHISCRDTKKAAVVVQRLHGFPWEMPFGDTGLRLARQRSVHSYVHRYTSIPIISWFMNVVSISLRLQPLHNWQRGIDVCSPQYKLHTSPWWSPTGRRLMNRTCRHSERTEYLFHIHTHIALWACWTAVSVETLCQTTSLYSYWNLDANMNPFHNKSGLQERLANAFSDRYWPAYMVRVGEGKQHD